MILPAIKVIFTICGILSGLVIIFIRFTKEVPCCANCVKEMEICKIPSSDIEVDKENKEIYINCKGFKKKEG